VLIEQINDDDDELIRPTCQPMPCDTTRLVPTSCDVVTSSSFSSSVA